MLYASDYFDKMYECACELIRRGKAYVCDLSPEDWEKYRGDSTRPGTNPPGRNRTVEENLDLFARMKAGEFADVQDRSGWEGAILRQPCPSSCYRWRC